MVSGIGWVAVVSRTVLYRANDQIHHILVQPSLAAFGRSSLAACHPMTGPHLLPCTNQSDRTVSTPAEPGGPGGR